MSIPLIAKPEPATIAMIAFGNLMSKKMVLNKGELNGSLIKLTWPKNKLTINTIVNINNKQQVTVMYFFCDKLSVYLITKAQKLCAVQI